MKQARCLPGLKWVNDASFSSDDSLVSDITAGSVKPAVGVDLRVPLQFDCTLSLASCFTPVNFIWYVAVQSQFVNLTAVVDTASLDDKSRLLLPILADSLFMVRVSVVFQFFSTG